MSTILPTLPPGTRDAAPSADVVIANGITIPGWINNLESYRRWAESDSYPQSGWVSYLNGIIWVDDSREEFITHNQVRYAFYGVFGFFLRRHAIGCFVPSGMFFANEHANLATEPDGLLYLWSTMREGRLRLVPGIGGGYTQLQGTPDAVLQVVSDNSVNKDVVMLRNLYWKAQIPEYWLVDARKEPVQFDILRHTSDGYQPTPNDDGWVRSEVLGRSCRIERKLDPLGPAHFAVQVKA